MNFFFRLIKRVIAHSSSQMIEVFFIVFFFLIASYQNDMKEASTSPIEAWLKSYIIENFYEIEKELIGKAQFYLFKEWCKKCGIKLLSSLKKPKSTCLTRVGQYIGLEPTTVFSRWYPSVSCDPLRIGHSIIYLYDCIYMVHSVI